MFQKSVNRQYTTSFAGELLRDGTVRAKPARIVSATVGSDGSTNRVSRVFGYSASYSIPDPALLKGAAFDTPEVVVGGANFFGILFHPKHYVLRGTAGDSLAASLDLPQGSEGEFLDATAGLCVEIYNASTSAATVTYRDKLAYVPVGISGANNPLGLPLGAIVAYTTTLPTGLVAIPNAFVSSDSLQMAASASGALVATLAMVQLAN